MPSSWEGASGQRARTGASGKRRCSSSFLGSRLGALGGGFRSSQGRLSPQRFDWLADGQREDVLWVLVHGFGALVAETPSRAHLRYPSGAPQGSKWGRAAYMRGRFCQRLARGGLGGRRQVISSRAREAVFATHPAKACTRAPWRRVSAARCWPLADWR